MSEEMLELYGIKTLEERQADEIARLRVTLASARDKLRHYRDAWGSSYVGGMEYSALMREIDASLK